MSFFNGGKSILLIISDGKETDSFQSYRDIYRGFCSTPAIEDCYPEYTSCSLAGIVGVPAVQQALNVLTQNYNNLNCASNPQGPDGARCNAIVNTYLDTSKNPLELKQAALGQHALTLIPHPNHA